MDSQCLSVLLNLFSSTIWVPILQIFHYCSIEEVRGLRDEDNTVSEGEFQVFQVMIIQKDLSRLRIEEPEDQIEQSALSSSTFTDDSDEITCIDHKRKVLKDRSVRSIGKGNVSELKLSRNVLNLFLTFNDLSRLPHGIKKFSNFHKGVHKVPISAS